MTGVNKTLYIPLYGKAYVSRLGRILQDKKAEEIWEAEGFALRGKAKSKWLAYYMAMRSAVFDLWLEEQLQQYPDAVILHLGCGMDSRCQRVACGEQQWFDLDFPDVIRERKRYFRETEHYHMIASDLRDEGWLQEIPSGRTAIILLEGVSMYLQQEELETVLKHGKAHLGDVRILMDSYTVFAAKATKYKNPINQVGVTKVYGLDDPKELERDTGITFVREHAMTPDWLIDQLPEREQWLFRKLYAGHMAKKLYRLYEFE